jgi:hypothetical protein
MAAQTSLLGFAACTWECCGSRPAASSRFASAGDRLAVAPLRITPTLLEVDSEPLPPGLWVPLVALVIAGPMAGAVMDHEGWPWGVVAAGIGGIVCGILLRVWSRGQLGRTRGQSGDRRRQARGWRNPVTGALIARSVLSPSCTWLI